MNGPTSSLLRAKLSLAPDGDEHAAVALIVAGPRQEIGLIRRAENPRDPWSGQMALPGGRREPHDRNLVGTAIRETQEEIGTVLAEADYLGRLPGLQTYGAGRKGPLSVAACVFEVGVRPEASVSSEVAEVLWVERAQLVHPSAKTTFRYRFEGGYRDFPALELGGRIVWGLTHRILVEFLALTSSENGFERDF